MTSTTPPLKFQAFKPQHSAFQIAQSGANLTKEKPDIPLLTVLVVRGARSGRNGGTSHPCGELRLACQDLSFQRCLKTYNYIECSEF